MYSPSLIAAQRARRPHSRGHRDPRGTLHDFVAFVRNVGEPRDKELGAGTFGFGKSIFYLISRRTNDLVYTRCQRPSASTKPRILGAPSASCSDVQRRAAATAHGAALVGMPGAGCSGAAPGRTQTRSQHASGSPVCGDETRYNDRRPRPRLRPPTEDMRAIASCDHLACVAEDDRRRDAMHSAVSGTTKTCRSPTRSGPRHSTLSSPPTDASSSGEQLSATAATSSSAASPSIDS